MDYATQQFNLGSITSSDSDVYVRGMGSQKKNTLRHRTIECVKQKHRDFAKIRSRSREEQRRRSGNGSLGVSATRCLDGVHPGSHPGFDARLLYVALTAAVRCAP
jgi:hypothetical protein